jgi:DNA-binding response OmpR family regulator
VARLLVVEDDPEIVLILERFFKHKGHTVVVASDGAIALGMLDDSPASEPFDVLLIDIYLPRMGGVDLMRHVRGTARGKSVGIVLMSAGFKGGAAQKEALAQGADAIFPKPFVLGELQKKVEELAARNAGSGTARPSDARSADTGQRLRSVEQVRSPVDAARLFLRAARQRFTGIARFVDERDQLVLGFVSGVIVGANDNLREHLLGERLWKQGRLTTEQMRALNQRMAAKSERVAEALLALGLCSADEALTHVEEQAMMRARRALSWNGAVQFKENASEAQALASVSIDVLDVVLGFGCDPAQQVEAARFVASHASERLHKHPAFQDMLGSFARAAPMSKLPTALFAGLVDAVVDAAQAASAPDTYAAWLAGLLYLDADGPIDTRPLPDLLRSDTGPAPVDKQAVELVCETLLRARGSNFYRWLDVARGAPMSAVNAKLQLLRARVGAEALEGKALGPATAAARELWTLLDEAGVVFSDPDLRAAYDASLPPPTGLAPRFAVAAEEAFLDGQSALAAGDLVRACACFSVAAEAEPDDPNYAAYFGWTLIISGSRTDGEKRLVQAVKDHPQGMRPLFFMGLLAAEDGHVARAKQLLEECARRAPDDIEVRVALEALQ